MNGINYSVLPDDEHNLPDPPYTAPCKKSVDTAEVLGCDIDPDRHSTLTIVQIAPFFKLLSGFCSPNNWSLKFL